MPPALYCETHADAPTPTQERDKLRGTAAERGYNSEWRFLVRRDGYFTEMKSRTWLFCLIFAFVPFSENEVNPRSIHYQPGVSQGTGPV